MCELKVNSNWESIDLQEREGEKAEGRGTNGEICYASGVRTLTNGASSNEGQLGGTIKGSV